MLINPNKDIAEFVNKTHNAEVTEDQRLELVDTLKQCYNSLAMFCRIVYPEAFRVPFTRLHHMMFEILDDESEQKVCIAAPRGIGKTTTVSIGLMSREILFQNRRFIPYVAKTSTYAEMQTENLKRSMMQSEIVRTLFGTIKAKKGEFTEMDEGFSKKSWVARLDLEDEDPYDPFSTFVLPRGGGQQVRGLKFGHFRPDFFQIDDLEDDSEITNEDLRKKLKQWLLGQLMEAVSQLEEESDNWRVVYTDTVKHQDALIEHILERDDWTSLRLSICDENYKTYIPTFMSQERLDAKIDGFRKSGEMDVFAREFMCQPISKETQTFKADLFQYFSESDEEFLQRRNYFRNVLIVDPAKTTNPSSAETGIVIWSVDLETNALYNRFAGGFRLQPTQMYEKVFKLAQLFNIQIIGIESTGLSEYIMQPFHNAMTSRGLMYELVELKAKRGVGEFAGPEGGKAGRVASLLPLYEAKMVYHSRTASGPLELQLLSYPRPKRWDVMDAAGYITHIMEKYTMYFSPLSGDDIYRYDDEYVGMSDNFKLEPTLYM